MTDEVWSCSHCGPHPGSSSRWCDAGCGSDYNEMTRVDPVKAWQKAEADLAALREHVAGVIARCEKRSDELHPLRNSIDVGEIIGVDGVAAWLRDFPKEAT